jgi:hypothetical protein
MTSTSTIAIFILATLAGARSRTCADPIDSTTSVICGQLFKDLERVLTSNEGNLLNIRRAFFHSPAAAPVLLKVVYRITYAENFTTAVSLEEMLPCSSPILQNSTIDLNQTELTLGWTSSGVYTMFHPILLSVMQVQTPFAFLRVIHLTLPDQQSPEANSFLWDGSYDLPTLRLNLHISTLSCVPSQEIFETILKDMNTLVRPLVVHVHVKLKDPGIAIACRVENTLVLIARLSILSSY